MVKINDSGIRSIDYVLVPCGHCPDCLRHRSNVWAHRLEQENKQALSSYFVTLTYDDENLPQNESVDKKDVQLFFKRLRQFLKRKLELDTKLRYFLVSEYGDSFGRPHYHSLIFLNHRVDLLVFMKAVYRSWEKGRIDIGNVTPGSIRYCSKYCLKNDANKPYNIDPDTGEIKYFERVFSLMSRRPAIGANFLTDNMKKYLSQGVFALEIAKDKYIPLARYYKEKSIPKDVRRANTIRMMKEYFGEMDHCDYKKVVDHEKYCIHHNKVKLSHDKIRK